MALIGPALLGIDLEAECKRYEEKHGGKKEVGGAGTAWHHYELRAYRVRQGGLVVGKTAAAGRVPDPRTSASSSNVSAATERSMDAPADTVIQAGDIVAVAGRREVLVDLIGAAAEEVDDRELLAVPVEGVDVYVTSKDVDGKTLAELAPLPWARGVFLRKIARGATATEIPILPDTKMNRGDILTLVGRTQDIAAATKALGYTDRATDVADVAFIGAAIAIGALLGAIVYKIGGVPLTLSTSGGALISGLFFGWLRSVRPTFRTDSVIDRVVHELGRPQRVHRHGRHLVGAGLRGWPAAARLQPVPVGHVRNHGAADPGHVCRASTCSSSMTPLLLGCCLRRAHDHGLARHDQRPGQEPDPRAWLHRTYAVGNTLLTIWGMVLVMLMT